MALAVVLLNMALLNMKSIAAVRTVCRKPMPYGRRPN